MPYESEAFFYMKILQEINIDLKLFLLGKSAYGTTCPDWQCRWASNIFFDPRGKAVPRIMYLKRSWVDAKYRYEPSVSADERGGILMPDIRRVRKLNK